MKTYIPPPARARKLLDELNINHLPTPVEDIVLRWKKSDPPMAMAATPALVKK
jgi:hypothetical protein